MRKWKEKIKITYIDDKVVSATFKSSEEKSLLLDQYVRWIIHE